MKTTRTRVGVAARALAVGCLALACASPGTLLERLRAPARAHALGAREPRRFGHADREDADRGVPLLRRGTRSRQRLGRLQPPRRHLHADRATSSRSDRSPPRAWRARRATEVEAALGVRARRARRRSGSRAIGSSCSTPRARRWRRSGAAHPARKNPRARVKAFTARRRAGSDALVVVGNPQPRRRR